jgi:hypothetical protein
MVLPGDFARWGGGSRSYSFANLGAGKLAGSLTRVRGPNIECEMVWIKADPDNTGDIWIGGADVSSDVGLELVAGDVFGWTPINNLNALYYVCSVAADKLQYVIVK